MKKLYTYIGRYWYGYLFAVFSMVTAIVLDMLYPKITQQIVDDVIIGGKLELLTKLLVGIVIVGIGRSIFGYCKEFTFDVLASKIGSAMRKDLFDHIQSLSMGYFEDTNTGELMARVKDDVDKIWNAMGYVGMLVIEVIIHVSMVLYCMFSLNWKLAFVPLATMILCGTVAIIMERKLDKIYEDISEENAVLTTVAEENLAGVRTVKAFAREKHEIEKFLSHNNRYYELNVSQAKVLTKYYPLFSFVGKVLPVCSTILGGIFVMNGEMTLGALVAFVEYSRNCTWPMEMLGWLTNDVSSAVASYKKIRKIYAEQPKIKNDEHPKVLDEIRGEICFDHAGFVMDGQKILQDINVTVPAGKTLGIMGATGSGKSSIVNLLQRFYDVTEGAVKVDGTDVRDLTLKSLRDHIGMVQQDVYLFVGTVYENIRYGRPDATREEVIEAAKNANAHEFIMSLPQGYETDIGQRGIKLSGGQKQRLSIARVFLKNPPILIFDEATSALDNESEKVVQDSLEKLAKNRTTFVIAHRLSTIKNAEKILVLTENGIEEEGTHEELLAKKGIYEKLYHMQFQKQ